MPMPQPLAPADPASPLPSPAKPKKKIAAAKALILPPCVLVGADANAWSVIGRVRSAMRAAQSDGSEAPRWMVSMSKTYEDTLALALCLVTPVSLADSRSARWAPFFDHRSKEAYQKACVGAAVWKSAAEPLDAYLANGGDLSRRDAFGRSWLFEAAKEARAGDHAKALALTPEPLSRDSLGTPFFAHAPNLALAADVIRAASDEELEAAMAPDKAFGCDPISWLLARRFIPDAASHPPTDQGLALALEALLEKGRVSIEGSLPKDLTKPLLEAMKSAKLGGSQPHERFGTTLARLCSRALGEGSVAEQARAAFKQAQKSTPALKALFEREELEGSLAPAPKSGRGRPRA